MVWLRFESLVNARDLGGTPTTDGGMIAPGVLLRSDNLQDLTAGDVQQLRDIGVTDVVDLRSFAELAAEGPGPLTTDPGVTIHHFTLLPEDDPTPLPDDTDVPDVSEIAGDTAQRALPWVGLTPSVAHDNAFASHYLSYLQDRPASIVGALRAIAAAPGAVLVHCAAGKDRTGTTIALALAVAGAERAEIVADYARSSERMQLIVDRLSTTPTYRENVTNRPLASHLTHPESMDGFLTVLETEYGGVEEALTTMGWTAEDSAALRRKLRATT